MILLTKYGGPSSLFVREEAFSDFFYKYKCNISEFPPAIPSDTSVLEKSFKIKMKNIIDVEKS